MFFAGAIGPLCIAFISDGSLSGPAADEMVAPHGLHGRSFMTCMLLPPCDDVFFCRRAGPCAQLKKVAGGSGCEPSGSLRPLVSGTSQYATVFRVRMVLDSCLLF